MRAEFLLRQLEQAEAQVQLAAAAIRSLREEIEAGVRAATPEPEEDADGRCLHPASARTPAPAMGNPGKFFCNRCRQFGGKQ